MTKCIRNHLWYSMSAFYGSSSTNSKKVNKAAVFKVYRVLAFSTEHRTTQRVKRTPFGTTLRNGMESADLGLAYANARLKF